jgi:hypothetical protein
VSACPGSAPAPSHAGAIQVQTATHTRETPASSSPDWGFSFRAASVGRLTGPSPLTNWPLASTAPPACVHVRASSVRGAGLNPTDSVAVFSCYNQLRTGGAEYSARYLSMCRLSGALASPWLGLSDLPSWHAPRRPPRVHRRVFFALPGSAQSDACRRTGGLVQFACAFLCRPAITMRIWIVLKEDGPPNHRGTILTRMARHHRGDGGAPSGKQVGIACGEARAHRFAHLNLNARELERQHEHRNEDEADY